MYSETANSKSLTTKKYEYLLEEEGQGFPYSYVY
jgi:hypothetical protein